MSGSELRGSVPAALEELRQARSGGVLVWFFELLWAYCPESRGLRGTDESPGLQHHKTASATNIGPQVDAQWQRSEQAVNSAAAAAAQHGNNNNASDTASQQRQQQQQRNMDSTAIFGDWEEDPDELLLSADDPRAPHDDFLWLPALPPTVLLNFSRLQAWYFTPKTRMQMQRDIAFYSVAEDDANHGRGLYANGNGTNINSSSAATPAPNDVERLIEQFFAREEERKRHAQKKREAAFESAISSHTALVGGSTDPQQQQLPEPERTLTLGQRQCLGVRGIAERYKREHSSNADELPAPVLKRLRGRLSTAVIVDAFEREYKQGLKVEHLTTHGLAMQQAERDSKGARPQSPLALASWSEDDEGGRKKRKVEVRHYPSGWICPEGPEQQQLQYDRIVAQLIRKSADGGHSSSSSAVAAVSSSGGGQRRGNNNNNNAGSDLDASFNDSDDGGGHNNTKNDPFAHFGKNNNSAEADEMSAADRLLGFGSRRSASSLPSAAKTAQMLTASLCIPKVEYLTMEALRRVLCSGTLGQAALLQQFVPPPPPTAVGNARFNETLYFRWQPRWRFLERCTNGNSLDDYTVPARKRGPTFEGPPGTSVSAMLGHATLYRLERACRAIVRHVFTVSQHTARILRLHCVFKFDEKLTLVLQCVIEAYAVNPRAVPPPTSIPNIIKADAHLPRVKSASSGGGQQQPQQGQTATSFAAASGGGLGAARALSFNNRKQAISAGGGGGGGSGSNLKGGIANNNNNSDQDAGDPDAVTSTGWMPVPLDPDDIRQSPIRAVAAMSRGEARHAAVRKTMQERVAQMRARHERKMMPDYQGVVKPIEEMRMQADKAFAAMNPKAAKALDALFARRDRRRQLMRAGNESAFDDGGVNDSKQQHHNNVSGASLSTSHQNASSMSNDLKQQQNNRSASAGSPAPMVVIRKRRTVNQFSEASETIDDLTWGRQSQLARALLRPVASRDVAQQLPFHRRPVRSLAAECGASGVGTRYISTMKHASTPVRK